MEWMNNNLSNLNSTINKITKIMALTSAMLLTWCKDNQIIKYNNTSIENIQDKKISYKPNAEELWIHDKYTMNVSINSDGTYSIFSSKLAEKDVDISTLKNYCNNNGMSDIIINEENKTEIVEAIIAMLFKDELLSQWKEELWLYVFNTLNQSDSKNILNSCFDNEYNDIQPELITDNIPHKYIKSTDTLSLEDQYLLAEQKQNDSTISEKERQERAKKYNRLSTEFFKLTKDEITSISQY